LISSVNFPTLELNNHLMIMKKALVSLFFIILPLLILGQDTTAVGDIPSPGGFLDGLLGDALANIGAMATLATTITGYAITWFKLDTRGKKQIAAAAIGLALTALGAFVVKTGYLADMPIWELALNGVGVAVTAMGISTIEKVQAFLSMIGAFVPKPK